MAIGSAIDRSGYDEVDPAGSAGDRGSIVRITTIEGRLVEGVYETEVYRDDQRALVLNRGDRDGGLFRSSARRDTVRVDEIAQLETQGKPGRYRDLLAVSGALVDATVVAYILGGLVQLGD